MIRDTGKPIIVTTSDDDFLHLAPTRSVYRKLPIWVPERVGFVPYWPLIPFLRNAKPVRNQEPAEFV